MKYMLTIYGSNEVWDVDTAESIAERDRVHRSIFEELSASGELIDSAALSNHDAKVVRTHDGVSIVSDGPFTEAKEMIGGYYVVDCVSLDRAVEIAGRFYEAELSPIEVRRLEG